MLLFSVILTALVNLIPVYDRKRKTLAKLGLFFCSGFFGKKLQIHQCYFFDHFKKLSVMFHIYKLNLSACMRKICETFLLFLVTEVVNMYRLLTKKFRSKFSSKKEKKTVVRRYAGLSRCVLQFTKTNEHTGTLRFYAKYKIELLVCFFFLIFGIQLSQLSRIYTGDFFACNFLIKMDVAKLHLFNNGSHCDKSYLTAENDCLKLFPFR